VTENGDPEDSALRPAESDLHPADPADDLTGNTPAGAGAGPDERVPADEPAAPGEPAPDEARSGDRIPGDGSVEHDRPDEPDAMRTVERGRETAAARADLSDDKPTPTATPAD
jgi:hypothetical protein